VSFRHVKHRPNKRTNTNILTLDLRTMTTTIKNTNDIDAVIEALLAVYPMTSIVYEVIGNELHYEVVPHEVLA
jgi:hypothetical protein